MYREDGSGHIRDLDVYKRQIRTRIVTGGPLSDRKGVNVPDVVLPIPILTEKDRRDLEFALSLGVDLSLIHIFSRLMNAIVRYSATIRNLLKSHRLPGKG